MYTLEDLLNNPLTPDMWKYAESLPHEEWENIRTESRKRHHAKGMQILNRIKTILEKRYDMICVASTLWVDAEMDYSIQEYNRDARSHGLLPEVHVKPLAWWEFKGEFDFQGFDMGFVLVSKQMHRLMEKEWWQCEKVERAIARGSGYGEQSFENRNERGVEPKHSMVYFLLFPASKQVKIGFTTQLEKRLRAYATHNAESFQLLKTIKGTISLEKDIHKKLQHYRAKKEFFHWCEPVETFINSIEEM